MRNQFIRTALCLALLIPSSYITKSNPMLAMNVLPKEVVVKPTAEQLKKKTRKPHSHRKVKGEFMGFKLASATDTTIHSSLKSSLGSYKGPETRINSLRRHWGTKSQHECGKAVDFEWSEELIEYLVGEEGQQWLADHDMMFYIEDRPGSKYLKKYLASPRHKEYVFENPSCTGKHIHIQIKK